MPVRHVSLCCVLAAAALLVACAPARDAVAPAAPPTNPEAATAPVPATLEAPVPATLEAPLPAEPDVIPALAADPDDNPYLPTTSVVASPRATPRPRLTPSHAPAPTAHGRP